MVKSTNNMGPNDQSHPVLTFLEVLESKSVLYVSWKNNHEITDALAGKTDLDIFVPYEYRASFMSVCGEVGWLHVENPLARFPWVIHLYKSDDNQRLYHLHVYFKVITGESWIKEYQLPLDRFLIENRVRTAEGVWVLDARAQACLFAIRHLLKGSSISSRALYRREFESYRQEWGLCVQSPQAITEYGPIRLAGYLEGSGLSEDALTMPRLMTALRFRISLLPSLRISGWSLPFRRAYNLLARVLNRYLFKRKKILPHGGLVIAISGVDGAGKSTMLAETHRFFSRFLTVDCCSLGRPQGRVVEAIRRLVGRGKGSGAASVAIYSRTSGSPSIRRSVSAMVLSLLRLRMARRAICYARHGHLVLADRWPTDQPGRMDGPRLLPDIPAGLLANTCARIERWAYARMPRADVCFFLKLPLEVALERNRTRVKDEKESDEEITSRFNQNQQFSPLAVKIVPFENGGDLNTMRPALLKLMWQEVIDH